MNNDNSHSGLLYLVGLGPGADKVLTPAARAALEDSEAVVGFRAYVEHHHLQNPIALVRLASHRSQSG